MLEVLERADLVCATALVVRVDGTIELSSGRQEDHLFKGGAPAESPKVAAACGIPTSCAGHTLAAYRRLPDGWQPAPLDVSPDTNMWRQFATSGACRIAATSRVTVVRFPSAGERKQLSQDDRLAELDRWWRFVHEPRARADIYAIGLAAALTRLDELDRARLKLRRIKADARRT